ncbi:MAG: TraR/DksA family transcriptional regulator [Magnetospirillum sp.]|nr:MAG: TraR/DksA family transcriptional regulator [Magnetospirillum sp.]
MDDLDYAAERAEVFTEAALRSVLGRLAGAPSSGVCRSCTDPIEAERLRANPMARLCSCCAADEEHHHQRSRRCGPRGN